MHVHHVVRGCVRSVPHGGASVSECVPTVSQCHHPVPLACLFAHLPCLYHYFRVAQTHLFTATVSQCCQHSSRGSCLHACCVSATPQTAVCVAVLSRPCHVVAQAWPVTRLSCPSIACLHLCGSLCMLVHVCCGPVPPCGSAGTLVCSCCILVWPPGFANVFVHTATVLQCQNVVA